MEVDGADDNCVELLTLSLRYCSLQRTQVPCKEVPFECSKAETSIANWQMSVSKSLPVDPTKDDCLLVRMHCERKLANVVYQVNYKLYFTAGGATHEQTMHLVKKGEVRFEPLDLHRPLFRLDWTYLMDKNNMFFDKNYVSDIHCEMSVSKIGVESFEALSDGVLDINGRLVFVKKELLSEFSPVFDAMFNSPNFVESQQEHIKLQDVEYEEMVELMGHIYYPRFQNLDEYVEYSCKAPEHCTPKTIIQPVQDSIEVLAQLIEKQSSVSKRMIKSDLHDTAKYLSLYLCLQPTYDSNDYEQVTEQNIEGLIKLADFYQIEELLLKCENWLLASEDDTYCDIKQLLKRLYIADKYGIGRLMENCWKHIERIFAESKYKNDAMYLRLSPE
uniref:BTB domain-containing protein n=1 Tax=Ditylenchus dipsaci TaxID=166011 RepID=A0A915EK82_9BILA